MKRTDWPLVLALLAAITLFGLIATAPTATPIPGLDTPSRLPRLAVTEP